MIFTKILIKLPMLLKKMLMPTTEKKKSRAFYLRQKLNKPQDMVLMHEILGPPKALKNERSKHWLPC